MTLANPPVPDVELAQLRVVVVDELVAGAGIGLDGQSRVELCFQLVDRLNRGHRPSMLLRRALGSGYGQRRPARIDGPRRLVLGEVELLPQDVLIRGLVHVDGYDVEWLEARIDARLLDAVVVPKLCSFRRDLVPAVLASHRARGPPGVAVRISTLWPLGAFRAATRARGAAACAAARP